MINVNWRVIRFAVTVALALALAPVVVVGGGQPSAKIKPAIAPAAYHMSPGKTRPPVEVTLEPGQVLQAGTLGGLRFHVRFPEGLRLTAVAVQGGESLLLTGQPALTGAFETGGMEVFKVVQFELTATPLSGGTGQLRGIVRFNVNGVEQAAPFNIGVPVSGPLTMARAAQKPREAPEIDATGEIVHSMKAETKVGR